MVQREEVLKRTKQIIQENMPDMFGSVDDMTEKTTLNKQNGNIDSMGFILIITKLEAEFNAEVPDHKWNRLTTLGDLVDAIVEYSKN
jgi:acyl carrier protein